MSTLSFPSLPTGATPISQPTHRLRSDTSPRRGEPAVVVTTLPNRMILVETEGGDRVAVHAAGAVRVTVVRLMAGDGVTIERSPFDRSKGRIVALDRVFPEHQCKAPNRRVADETRITPFRTSGE